jgi:hypothetical protein
MTGLKPHQLIRKREQERRNLENAKRVLIDGKPDVQYTLEWANGVIALLEPGWEPAVAAPE